MNISPIISYELAQGRITDLRHQAGRESLVRAALAHAALASTARQSAPPPRKPRVPGRLRLRLRSAL
jgi:hypothetical protein